jgi:hypothetical protein
MKGLIYIEASSKSLLLLHLQGWGFEYVTVLLVQCISKMNMIMILINFMINVVLPNCRNRNASSNFESNFEKDGSIYSCHAADRVFNLKQVTCVQTIFCDFLLIHSGV